MISFATDLLIFLAGCSVGLGIGAYLSWKEPAPKRIPTQMAFNVGICLVVIFLMHSFR